MSQTPPPDPAAAKRRSQRMRGFLILAVVVVVGAAVWGVFSWVTGARYVKTDNAYVGASNALITPQIDGTILEVPIHETQLVHRGDVLVQLDKQVPELQLSKAQSEYRQAVSRVEGYHAADVAAAAGVQAQDAAIAAARTQVERAQSDIDRAQSDLDRAQSDLARRQSLAGSGAVSTEEVNTAQAQVRTAQAQVRAAQAAQRTAQSAVEQATAAKRAAEANLTEQQTRSGGPKLDSNPEVELAKNEVAGAQLRMEYTTLRAPIDGVIAGNKAQIGQKIGAGTVLMSIVPVQDAFVDANFKEGQLKRVTIGQPVELTSDLYGDKVVFHGHVVGIGGGTGAAFAAIPAQNATGNWIKVVQRVPVRISLDPKELAAHPLRVGLSMSAKIDVGTAK